MTLALHPADQAAADRIGRSFQRLAGRPAPAPDILRCDHGRLIGECRTCLQLRHAEERSVTVRAAYAFGEWPPA